MILVCSCLSVYSQNLNYGLSQQDLNLLLGQFLPSSNISGYRWIENTYSWGKQKSVDTNGDVIFIDYYSDFFKNDPSRQTSRIGQKYKNCLIINTSSINFLISKIEKIMPNKYVLTLVLIENQNNPKNAGQITITFLDDIHIVIDNTNCLVNLFNHLVLWKSAGPTITVNNKKPVPNLPDFKE
jgi:hypothetical protein